MSTVVKDIADAMTTQIGIALGATYSELDYIINVEKNDWERSQKRYGVRPLDGVLVPGVINSYTVDQVYQVIISDAFVSGGADDQDQRDVTFDLLDQIDKCLEQLIEQKLGLTGVVLLIQEASVAEPEYIANNIVVMRKNITVKYRRNIF